MPSFALESYYNRGLDPTFQHGPNGLEELGQVNWGEC